MAKENIIKFLDNKQIIASIQNHKDFLLALACDNTACIMLKFGDLQTLPALVAEAHRKGKKIMVYLDSIKGVAKDASGIHYLSQINVDSVATTKPQLISIIKDANILAIQCMFLIDMTALRSGIDSIKKNKPDATILMPMSIPSDIIDEILAKTSANLLLGGLVRSERDVRNSITKGALGTITSQKSLWNYCCK